jgi:cell wall-associated NlpC family hydrolase
MNNHLWEFFKTLTKSKFFHASFIVFLLFVLVNNYSSAKKAESEIKEKWINSSEVPQYSTENDQLEKVEELKLPTKADSLIEYAHTLQGVPYKWAGKTRQGFDCSGFIFHVFQEFGINVPAGSKNLYQLGAPISKDDLIKGDLVFFTGTQVKDREVGHVGIIVSNPGDKLQFIHSSSGGGGRGVTVNDLEHHHYKARYLGARRIDLM